MKKLLALGLLLCTCGIYSQNNEKKDHKNKKSYQSMESNTNKSKKVKSGTKACSKILLKDFKKNRQVVYQNVKPKNALRQHDVKKILRNKDSK